MADGSLTPTGMTHGSNIYNFSTARAASVVVDGILNSTTFASRMLRQAKPFRLEGQSGEQPTLIKNVKVTRRSQFQWFSGLENLNSSAENVVVQMQYNEAFGTLPLVEIMTESFAREGGGEDVDYPAFDYEDALDETVQALSTALYGTGTGDQPLGLEAIVDDGTNLATLGGQTRATYSDTLNATVTASSGTMTLAKLATLVSSVSDSGAKEMPTIFITTQTIFDLYEQLLTPTVTHEYMKLGLTGRNPMAADKKIEMGQGFNCMSYRGIPIIWDKQATSGTMYLLNENYLHWHGRTSVAKSFKPFVKPVKLGKKVKEGQAADKPSDFHGFFYQEKQMMPNQAGIISRFYVNGQLVSFQPRRHGKLTGITSVA